MNVNNVLIIPGFGPSEMMIIAFIVMLLFGAKKLPELARGLAQGIKEFKKASNEVTEEINKVDNE